MMLKFKRKETINKIDEILGEYVNSWDAKLSEELYKLTVEVYQRGRLDGHIEANDKGETT